MSRTKNTVGLPGKQFKDYTPRLNLFLFFFLMSLPLVIILGFIVFLFKLAF